MAKQWKQCHCPEFSVGWPHAALLLPWLLHSASSLADFHANPSSLSILPVACLSQSACPEPACSLHHRAPGCVCRERWGWEMGALLKMECSRVSLTSRCRPGQGSGLLPGSPVHSPDKNAGVGSHPLFQGIFLTQGSNSCIAGRFLTI